MYLKRKFNSEENRGERWEETGIPSPSSTWELTNPAKPNLIATLSFQALRSFVFYLNQASYFLAWYLVHLYLNISLSIDASFTCELMQSGSLDDYRTIWFSKSIRFLWFLQEIPQTRLIPKQPEVKISILGPKSRPHALWRLWGLIWFFPLSPFGGCWHPWACGYITVVSLLHIAFSLVSNSSLLLPH